ncbi:MAG: LCP family protein [Anaerolineales bacterium]|nr:LCP family protein [Anaerolineales bacterium]
MRRSAVFLLILVSLLGTLLAACGTSEPEALPTRIPVALLPAADTAVPPTITPTATPTPDYSPTPGPSPTPSNTPTITPSPTHTPIPSATPTSRPQFAPTLVVTEPTLREGAATPATAVPTPVPTFEVPGGTTNVLLLGADEPLGSAGQKSDTILIVSINRDGPTASMISIPRDLYVYLPGSTMAKITVASQLGGVELLKQTILYNFGIPIHYYARVDFQGFQNVVDAIGGVDVAVNCEFTDWRLKSPELDIEDPDNWELYTLAPGIYDMDGELALWYARSRLRSSDFDRGRRQQQLLRALLNQGVDLGLVAQVPTLWSTYQDSVETDMDIGRILQLAALAPDIRANGVQNLYLAGKTTPWGVPTEDGGALSAQLPIWEGPGMMEETFARLFRPPTLSRAARAPITVEVVNATGNPDMARLAAENLAWYGFVPVLSDGVPETTENVATTITFYGPNFKGSYEWLMAWIMHKTTAEIQLNTEEAFAFNYRVILGADYDPCVNQLYSP